MTHQPQLDVFFLKNYCRCLIYLDYTFLLIDELLFNREGLYPSMTQKFLCFRSFPSFEEVSTCIIRINATVHIHYPDLPAFAPAVRHVHDLLILLQDPRIYDKQLMLPQNDDTFLDKIVGDHMPTSTFYMPFVPNPGECR